MIYRGRGMAGGQRGKLIALDGKQEVAGCQEGIGLSAEPNTVGIVVVDGWVGRFIEINRKNQPLRRGDEGRRAIRV
jgi:hypothetical protein